MTNAIFPPKEQASRHLSPQQSQFFSHDCLSGFLDLVGHAGLPRDFDGHDGRDGRGGGLPAAGRGGAPGRRRRPGDSGPVGPVGRVPVCGGGLDDAGKGRAGAAPDKPVGPNSIVEQFLIVCYSYQNLQACRFC